MTLPPKDHSQEHIDALKRNIGTSTWIFLHSVAATYSRTPTAEDRAHAKNLVEAVARFYPCSYCREDFQHDIEENRPQVQSREAFSMWLCERHNTVNGKLGKPLFDCHEVWKRWGKAANNAFSPSFASSGSATISTSRLSERNNIAAEGDDDDDDDCVFCEDKFGKERYDKLRGAMKGMGFRHPPSSSPTSTPSGQSSSGFGSGMRKPA